MTFATATKAGVLVAAAIAGAWGVVGAGRSHAEEVAHPTISAPALSTADIAGLRTDLAVLNAAIVDLKKATDSTGQRLDAFNTRLSWLEGATSGALAPAKPR